MSTHATIAIHNDDNTYTAIYLHWDGYIEAAGKTLNEHYNDETTIRQLMSLGDLSTLGEKPEDPGYLWKYEAGIHGTDTDYETFYAAYRTLTDLNCKSYRSRGEKHIDARAYTTEQELKDDREEYLYLWDKETGWRVTGAYVNDWKPLTEALAETESE